VVEWRDWTAQAIAFFERQAAASRPPALGIHVYVPRLAEKSRNPRERPAANYPGHLQRDLRVAMVRCPVYSWA